MANKNDIESLVRKFVENKASEHEIELLQEYFKTPIGLKYLDQIMDEYAADFDKAHLAHSSHDAHEASTLEENGRSLLFSGRMLRAFAATFIGMVMLAGIYFYISQVYSVTVYKTVAGQKTTITLPD